VQLVRFAPHDATTALIESYAYGMSTAARTLDKLGGVVRLERVRARLEGERFGCRARGTCCWEGAEGGRGDRLLRIRFETADEGAAFTALNTDVAELDGHCFAQSDAAPSLAKLKQRDLRGWCGSPAVQSSLARA
jgi:hypothetical protein